MHVKKYRAATTKEAFALARAELGDEAVLLHQRTLQDDARPGGAGPVEITVAVDVEETDSPAADVRPFFPASYASPQPPRPGSGRVLAASASARPLEPGPVQAQKRPAPLPFTRPQSASSGAPDLAVGTQGAASGYEALWREIHSIRTLLQNEANAALPEPLKLWRAALIDAMLPAAMVDTLLLGLETVLTPPALMQPDLVAATLARRLSAELPPVRGAVQAGRPGRPLIFVLVGPTGVGKTTTLAKLAARYSVQHRLPVALITADTFRIGAVGQLRTYSDLIRAPLEVAYTPQELAGHVARHQDKAVIFVDTPGRSPMDTDQLEVLRAFVGALPNPHLQIALAAGTLLPDARRIVERFSVAPPAALLLTKLDETGLCGPACALLAELNVPLSYFTVGQRVPEDIEVARNETLIERLLQSVRQQVEADRSATAVATAAMQAAVERLQPAL